MMKTIGYIAALAVVVASYFLTTPLPIYHYETTNREMSSFEVPWKGRGYRAVEEDYKRYVEFTKNYKTELRITSRKNWVHPSLWWENMTHPRWNWTALGFVDTSGLLFSLGGSPYE
ncbi:hypothetical protein G8768_12655 [Pseudoteredinibacter isoporae]|uniref:Uncharacterized protein n=2 Tax=Pseudoteredinibacter isoporae TaxID=570281 RepID=A0A7X0JU18_9GAMM|nr:hypothetical protein [Pseudoteredinibacter isoporae]MBB6522275.1 hypothetical protein [Pseudoteredinibacter isoporae]NHO87808.1 hypothetical protein [Pseudoteredinibacter isoporae]NIB23861.1 hypothetical protein [Pseudoteredinibacter isoporae]